MTQRSGEYRGLTGARGIAAWFVVLFHIRASIPGLPPAVAAVLAKGYLAVDFFFVLSGFVIALSWNDRLHDQGRRAVWPFLRKRIARVWPLHAVILTGTAIMAGVFVAAGRGNPMGSPFADLPLDFLLVQNWGLTDRLGWNVPSWSISAEFGAYLLYPLAAILVDWRRVPRSVLVAALAASLSMLAVLYGSHASLGDDVPRLGLARCLCEFFAGTMVFALWRRGGGYWVAALLAASAFAGYLLGMAEALAIPAGFAALTYLLTSRKLGDDLVGTRPLHFLGEVSYATYLLHYPLWILFRLLFVRQLDAVSWGVIATYLLAVLVGSLLLYRIVERPGQRLFDALRWPQPMVRAPR